MLSCAASPNKSVTLKSTSSRRRDRIRRTHARKVQQTKLEIMKFVCAEPVETSEAMGEATVYLRHDSDESDPCEANDESVLSSSDTVGIQNPVDDTPKAREIPFTTLPSVGTWISHIVKHTLEEPGDDMPSAEDTHLSTFINMACRMRMKQYCFRRTDKDNHVCTHDAVAGFVLSEKMEGNKLSLRDIMRHLHATGEIDVRAHLEDWVELGVVRTHEGLYWTDINKEEGCQEVDSLSTERAEHTNAAIDNPIPNNVEDAVLSFARQYCSTYHEPAPTDEFEVLSSCNARWTTELIHTTLQKLSFESGKLSVIDKDGNLYVVPH